MEEGKSVDETAQHFYEETITSFCNVCEAIREKSKNVSVMSSCDTSSSAEDMTKLIQHKGDQLPRIPSQTGTREALHQTAWHDCIEIHPH